MQSILITGGAGFIGSWLVRLLLAESRFRVVNLDKLTYAGNLDSLVGALDDPRHTLVHGDVADRPLVAALLDEHRPSTIIHLAAESHVDRSIDAPAAFLETNVVGTFQLLEAALDYWSALDAPARGAFRFVHVSTDEVYGSLAEGARFTETTPYAPNSPYSASKAAADHFARAFHRTYGLPVITTNSSNNYGPYQFPEKLVPLMILNAAEGKPLPLYGDGLQVRDWLYVEDHCRALLAALDRGVPGEVYNVGADWPSRTSSSCCRLCQLVDELCPAAPRHPASSLITFVADRPGHDRRYAIDAAKARRELGWQPRVSFEAGLRATVAWYLANPTWLERVTSGVYRRERLGLRI